MFVRHGLIQGKSVFSFRSADILPHWR